MRRHRHRRNPLVFNAQASALSRPDFDAVYVTHPIQDQTEAEVRARADSVVAEIAARLCG